LQWTLNIDTICQNISNLNLQGEIMNRYIIPALNTISSETLLVKLQASGETITPLECDSDVNCGAADLGGECQADFFGDGGTCDSVNPCSGASAQFFLQGSLEANPPACDLIVNGQSTVDCEDIEFIEACAEGAVWQLGCIGDFNCDGSDSIVVECDGQTGTLSDSCGFVALKD
jgi:hypothetical protein